MLTSDSAEFLYKTTDYGALSMNACLLLIDVTVGIPWPRDEQSNLAAKDVAAKTLKAADVFSLVFISYSFIGFEFMTLIVTGGIFVLDWLVACDEPIVNLDKLVYLPKPAT